MPKLTSEQQAKRRERLLDAAERCFVRDGFHRTSMQAIAKEAKSSAGALYLYFTSKEELIAGLIERDRAGMARDFGTVAEAADPRRALGALGRRLFVEDPRERWMLTLQIWSEAARNPTVRRLCQSIHEECRRDMSELLQLLAARGESETTAPQLEALVDLLMLIADGIFKQRSIDETFDTERALTAIMATLDAGLGGRIHLATAPAPQNPAPQNDERSARP